MKTKIIEPIKKENFQIYDQKGIPILVGDVLKIFHFSSGRGRNHRKHFMYKLVVEKVKVGKCGLPFLKIQHLNAHPSFYWQSMSNQIMRDIEIVQGYEGVKSGDTFLDRPRITVPKYKDNPLHSFIQPLQFNTYGYIE